MSSEELKPCSEPQAHPERCGCQPDAFQIARHSKRLVEQQRERIAALEAENARLVREAKNDAIAYRAVLERQDELRAERDAARAQLAAIQGGMGEEPLVVATAILGGLFHGGSGPELGEIDFEPDMKALERIQYELVNSSDDVSLDLMTVAQHQRIVASISAQQSAHVSVPRELLERTICRLTHGHEHDKAVRELRALLNGGEA